MCVIVVHYLLVEVMARMGSSPFFVSAVGTDSSGLILTDHLKKLSVVL